MGPLETQREALCLQDGSGALLFLFPHAWPPLKEHQRSPIPLSHESSQDGQALKYDRSLLTAQWLKQNVVSQHVLPHR